MSPAPASDERAWEAPGRANLIGEHTDYNDGWVLPIALRARTTVRAKPNGEGRLRVRSAQQEGMVECDLQTLAPQAVTGWAAYVAGAAWVLGLQDGADVEVDSSVPAGAGLSSSAALTVAAVGALAGERSLEPLEHARLARSVEADFVGAPVGMMDQLASVFGRAGHALLIDCRSFEVEPLPFDPAGAGLVLLVMDTKVEHDVGEGPYAERRESCEAAARGLGLEALRDASPADLERLTDPRLAARARHVVCEDERVLAAADCLRAGDLRSLGPLFTGSHASMRDLFEISTPELDAVCEAAEAAGALGARMTGGGFGGSAIALVEADAEARVREAVVEALAEVEIFAAVPSDGARRVA
jgi:galactokinase